MNLRAAIFVILLLVPGMVQAKDSVKIGYIFYTPMVVPGESGQPAGVVIEIIEQALSSEFDIEWVEIPIGRVEFGLRSGFIDAFAQYYYKRERESYAVYPDKPTVTHQGVLCSKLLAGKTFGTEQALLDELSGKAVISVLHSVGFPYRDNDRIQHIKLRYDRYIERGLAMLAQSRADYMFFPIGSVSRDKIKENGLSCVNIGKPLPIYIVFSKVSPYTERMKARFISVDTLHF